MSEEEIKEYYEELKSLLYTGNLSQAGKRKLIEIIEKQQEQLQEKDKIISLMGRIFQGILVSNEFSKKCLWKRICKIEKDKNYDCSNKLCEECVIEYFINKAREV